MPTRNSGYDRIANDHYVTPAWVYESLWSVEPWATNAVDVAIGGGHYDFLQDWDVKRDIATNPPFALADQFVRHSLDLPAKLNCAFLLPHAWDAAKRRVDLFKDRRFRGKYTLTTRIRWQNLEQKKAGPSSNHAWFVWRAEPRGFVKPAMGWL